MAEFSEQHEELAPKPEVESARELASQSEEEGVAESGVTPGDPPKWRK